MTQANDKDESVGGGNIAQCRAGGFHHYRIIKSTKTGKWLKCTKCGKYVFGAY